MTQRVKEFIEDYIDEIELGRWEEVFDGWYSSAFEYFWEDDEDQISELFSTLSIINVTKDSTVDARTNVISHYLQEIIEKIQDANYNRVDNWILKWNAILPKLNSTLGFSDKELYDILNNIDMAGVTPYYINKEFVVQGL